MTGELWVQIHVRSLFSIGHFVPALMQSRKLYGVYERCTYQTTILLLEMLFLHVHCSLELYACELQLARYRPRRVSWSRSDTTFCACVKHV